MAEKQRHQAGDPGGEDGMEDEAGFGDGGEQLLQSPRGPSGSQHGAGSGSAGGSTAGWPKGRIPETYNNRPMTPKSLAF